MFDAGRMRDRITFQAYNGNLDAHGDIRDDLDENWTDVATVWAAIDPLVGREFYEAGQSQSEVTHKIRCRFFPWLKAEQRIRHQNGNAVRTFHIISIIDWQNRHENVLIMAKELVE